MSTPITLPQQAAQKIDQAHSEQKYQKAHDLFKSVPLAPKSIKANIAMTDSGGNSGTSGDNSNSNADTGSDGAVQFHLIGMQPTDPRYNDMMNENSSNLLSIGGLVYNYMHSNYGGDLTKLDISAWNNVVSNVPDLSLGTSVNKQYKNTIAGTSISGEFLSLVAKAIITDGASLLSDFTSYLNSIGNVVFSLNTNSESYQIVTCTYTNYLVSNQVGGYFDYGAITLRQINFREHFMQFKGACSSVEKISIEMDYTEIINLVQTAKIRSGGADYNNFQSLISGNSTQQFTSAKSFFNAPKTPQNQVTPSN